MKHKIITSQWLSHATRDLKASLRLSPAQVGQFIKSDMINMNFDGCCVVPDKGIINNFNVYILEDLNV